MKNKKGTQKFEAVSGLCCEPWENLGAAANRASADQTYRNFKFDLLSIWKSPSSTKGHDFATGGLVLCCGRKENAAAGLLLSLVFLY